MPQPIDKTSMWTEKYRPKNLGDVAAHKEIISTSEPLSCPDPYLKHLTYRTLTDLTTSVPARLHAAFFQPSLGLGNFETLSGRYWVLFMTML